MTQPAIPTDYGIDLACTDDLAPTLSTVSGIQLLANALYRRLITPRFPLGGGLCYDPNYGTDVRQWLNDGLTGARDLIRKSTAIEQELRKDPRVVNSRTSGTFTAGVLTFTIVVTSSIGPFTMVVSVDNVTAKLVTPVPG